MDSQEQLPPGQMREQALRNGGFSDDEIENWKSSTTENLTNGGFSPQEVKDYFGVKEPDLTNMQATVKQNLAKAQTPQAGQEKLKREPVDTAIRPVEAKDIWDAMAAGWGNSILGLATNKEESPIQLGQDPGVAQSLAANVSGLIGDSPAMIAGAAVGGALSGGLGTAAGAFAVPQAMRKVLIDHYQKGDIVDAKDFAQRAVSTAWEGTKGAITGVATEFTGGLAGAVAGTTGKLASQVVAQTVVSNALEGKLPNKNDFINGAVMIGGLHAAGYTANKLMDVYKATGALPEEIIDAADKDPHLKGQILSENPNVPEEAKPQANPDAGISVEPEQENVPRGTKELTPDEAKVQEAKQEILSRIGEKAEKEKSSVSQVLKDNVADLYAKHLDYTKAVGDVISEIGDKPLDEKNAQVLMRLHAAVMDRVREFVEVGTRDFETGKINGESLQDIVGEYKDKTGDRQLEDLKTFAIAKRSLELEERGIKQPGDRANDQVFVDANPHLEDYMQRLTDYKNRTLDYLGASGRYSKEQIQAMKDLNKSYISFKKILDPDPLTGKYPTSRKDIQRIGDSERLLQDPILSTLQDTEKMIRMANENHARSTFVENMKEAEDPSEFFRQVDRPGAMLSDTQFEVYNDGKRSVYEAPKEVVDSLKAMAGNRPAVSIWTQMLRPFATALRIGTVDNPLFALRHAWRNQLTAPTLTQTGLKPFEALLYAPEYLAKGDSYHNFVYDGGATNSIVPLNEGYLDGKIYELNESAPFLAKAWNNAKTVAEFSHWAIVMNDNIVRFAEYQRMLEKGSSRPEAAFAAREVLPDFQKMGLQKSALQSITAFLNVHMQGMSRMAQETVDNPVGYAAKNLAYITVPSILLAAAQADDDAIQDLPDWQKYNYWAIHIPNWRPAQSLAEAESVRSAYPSMVKTIKDGSYLINDGNIVRIQKPFTNGILFGSMYEVALDAWRKQDPKGFLSFAKTVGGSTIAEPIPTFANPILEQATNRNFYTGQPLIRQSMENKLPEMQYDQYTSETAKALGKLISYVPLARDIGPDDAKISSPKVIENYLHGWGGTMGYYAIDVLDKALVKAGVADEKVKPVDTLADIPFVKEFMIRFPNARPQSVSDFESRYKQSDKVANSVKQLLKEGDIEGASQLQDRYAVNMAKLTGVDKAIQNMSGAIQKINRVPDIDPVEKRQLIDGLMYQMTTAAKEGNILMDEFEKSAKNNH